MKSIFFVTLLVLVSVNSSAQIVLKGKAPDFANKTISVFEYEDFFTRTRIEKVNQKIDSVGAFSLLYPLSEPLYIDIFLTDSYSGVYVQPGFSYELVFDKKGKIKQVISNDSTNSIIKEFETQDNALFAYQLKKNYYDKIRDFILSQKNKIKKLESFPAGILTYQLGMTERFLYDHENDTTSLNALEKKLFLLAPVNNSFPQYFELLKSYYYNRANATAQRHTEFNARNPLKSMVREAEFVKNDSIQQLAYLTILSVAYKRDWAAKERILAMNDSIVNVAANHKVKKAAQSLLRKNTSLVSGVAVKDFSFETYEGITHSLSDFKGKYVLLDFWFVGCSICVQNFPTLLKLKDESAGKLEVISLTPYDSSERIETFLKRRPRFTWLFSPIDKEGELMNYFNINAFPTYFLIDPSGNLIKRIEFTEMEEKTKDVAKLIK